MKDKSMIKKGKVIKSSVSLSSYLMA